MISHYYRQYKKFKFFLGKRVWFLLKLSSGVGFFLFLVESSFIFVLQGFLTAIGLVDSKNTFLPKYFPKGVIWAIAILVLFGLLRSIVFAMRLFFAEVTNQVFLRTQRERILDLALSQASEFSTHDLLNVFNQRIPTAASILQGLSNFINVLVSGLFFFALGFKLAPKELVFGISVLFLLFIVLRFINRKIDGLGTRMLIETKKLMEILVTGLRNNFLLRVYQRTEQEVNRGRLATAAFEELYNRFILMASIKSAFPQFAGTAVIGVVCFFSVAYTKTPSMQLVSFIYIFMRLAQGMSEGTAILMNIRFNWGSFKELYQWHLISENFFLSKGEAVPNIERANSRLNQGELLVEVRDLGFQYASREKLFEQLSFQIREGDILLLKGRSGSGKSTLLTLLLGLLEPVDGSILINGTIVSDLRGDLAPITAYVGPEPYIIQGSIRENLLYLNDFKNYTDEDLWKVLERAKIIDLVKKHELGLSWELKEVAELSTGQKQRLSIARALLRDPRIFILDEATANLDPVTEREIIEVIQGISKNTVTIVVSHKDSFDRIATKLVDLGN